MLDPDGAMTRPLLAVVLIAVVAMLVVRTFLSDRRRFPRFKRLRSTAKRQEFYRSMLRDSVLQLGLGSLVVLALTWQFVGPLLSELTQWPVIREARGFVGAQPIATAAIVGGLILVVVVVTALGVRAARTEGIVAIGDIAALLPRNRQELRWGWLLSINAGISEELMMRLALPALVYAVSGSAVIAVAGTVALFGALHAYQGASGVIGTTIVGALMMAFYAVSGTIVVPIVLHAVLNLRSLVFIPWAVSRVHLVDGVTHPIARAPITAPVAEGQLPPAAAAPTPPES